MNLLYKVNSAAFFNTLDSDFFNGDGSSNQEQTRQEPRQVRARHNILYPSLTLLPPSLAPLSLTPSSLPLSLSHSLPHPSLRPSLPLPPSLPSPLPPPSPRWVSGTPGAMTNT